jgi:hypothetical protein
MCNESELNTIPTRHMATITTVQMWDKFASNSVISPSSWCSIVSFIVSLKK